MMYKIAGKYVNTNQIVFIDELYQDTEYKNHIEFCARVRPQDGQDFMLTWTKIREDETIDDVQKRAIQEFEGLIYSCNNTK